MMELVDEHIVTTKNTTGTSFKRKSLEQLCLYYSDNSFKNIKNCNDEYDLFKQHYTNPNIDKSHIDEYLDSCVASDSCAEKDQCESEKLRADGNNRFKSRDYFDSIKCYNKSLQYAIYETENYALSLSNRSAAFFEIEYYKLCLSDVDKCISFNYSDKLKSKVYVRKARCLHRLGLDEELKCFVLDCKQFLFDERQVNTLDDLVNRLKKRRLSEEFNEENDLPATTLPTFRAGENVDFLNASSVIGLRYTKAKGRHVVAAKDLKQGEVLFIEKPFEFVKFQTETELRCNSCLTKILNIVPCQKCAVYIYCNDNCATADWEDVHRWECPGVRMELLGNVSSIEYLALKIVIRGLRSGPDMPDESSPEDATYTYRCKDNNYRFVNKLLTHFNNQSYNVINFYATIAMVFVVYLKKYTTFFNDVQPNVSTSDKSSIDALSLYVGGSIIKHCLQLLHNANYVTAKTLKSTIEETSLGVGIYPSISMMNHSCKPNITTFSINNYLIAKAFCDVKAGEEIFNCYSFNCRLYSTKERQTKLQDMYFFNCNCTECLEPTLSLEIVESYICTICKNPICDLSTEKILTCHSCRKTVNSSMYVNMEEKFNSLMAIYYTNTENIKPIFEAYETCKPMVSKLSNKIILCHKMLMEYYLAVDPLDIENIFLYVNNIVHLFVERFGDNSFTTCEFIVLNLPRILQKLKSQHITKAILCRDYLPRIKKLMHEGKRTSYFYFRDEEVERYFQNLEKSCYEVEQAVHFAMHLTVM